MLNNASGHWAGLPGPNCPGRRPGQFETGFGATDVTKPYKFIGFGAMDVTKPNKLMTPKAKENLFSAT